MGGQHSLPEIITECVITECTVQPDGRLSVHCTGMRRVHVVGVSEQDGYRICTVDEEVRDEPVASGERAQLKVCFPASSSLPCSTLMLVWYFKARLHHGTRFIGIVGRFSFLCCSLPPAFLLLAFRVKLAF
jgi:hypothetical protein